jgi:hypothetical protein
MTEDVWRTGDRFRDMAVMLTQPELPRGGLGPLTLDAVGRVFAVARWFGLAGVGHPAPPPVAVESSGRRLRLLTAACYAHLWLDFRVPVSRRHRPLTRDEWVDLLTRFADGRQTAEDIDRELEFAVNVTRGGGEMAGATLHAGQAAEHAHQLWHLAAFVGGSPIFAQLFPERSRVGCDLIRDVFGNPFRKAEFDPEWRTSTATGLAEAIYEGKAFDRMPILADALEDAGCDDLDVLAHCREAPLHVRGCWVVDRVLERS